ncbi:flagellar assembly protein FlgT [Brumicola nitratireducens]|uniref:flagellar assembly protein FlgT n=1 Tax=Brumicola nitratireducens TaxID=300231 RepID=UPI001EE643C0|nr:flagellar assembly protein FlgT [Glaciecola nitratireducens]
MKLMFYINDSRLRNAIIQSAAVKGLKRRNATLRNLIIVLSLILSQTANAAWFSATGHAAILNGDKMAAKHQATEEAIKQALLFAGASVRSVQQMTNGLLMNDHLEIRSSGEVSTLELIDEVYSDGYVTVSIRADIFSQKSQCSAADYTKRLATTYFPIRYGAQAADGQVHHLGAAAALKLQETFSQISTGLTLSEVEPYTLNWHNTDQQIQATKLAQKTDVQYVLAITIDDISVERDHASAFTFWKGDQAVRNFAYTLTLLNGASGEELLSKQYRISEAWEFDMTRKLDVNSDEFWRSRYGRAVLESMQESAIDLEKFAICEPTMGRILAVNNNQLQINLGKNQKVKAGDTLTLFSVKQIRDTFGQEYKQFVLHPTSLVVTQVFAETATVTSRDRSLLANIQPNDYVARQ